MHRVAADAVSIVVSLPPKWHQLGIIFFHQPMSGHAAAFWAPSRLHTIRSTVPTPIQHPVAAVPWPTNTPSQSSRHPVATPPQQECPSCSHKHTQNRLETFVDPPSCQPSRIHSRLAALPACTWQCHVRAPHGLMTHVQPVDMDGEARSQSGRDPNGWMGRLAR